MASVDFGSLVQQHRRELHVHCYRMLGSFEDAEDVVQETFLKAWRKRDSYSPAQTGGPRAWLYRIATNACIDAIRAKSRQVSTVESFAEVPWLQPYPDVLLDEVANPEAAAVKRETIELTFVAVLQLLPGLQRAVLLLRDVLEWSAAQTAELLEITVPAVNSALQRAKSTVRERLPVVDSSAVDSPAAGVDAQERDLLRRFIDAHERGDVVQAAAMVRDDLRITMPPNPWCFDGLDAWLPQLIHAFGEGSIGDWRLVPTRANRMPCAASYLRAYGETAYRAFKFDVLRVEGGLIVEITTFDASLFTAFGLPLTLEEDV